MHATSTARYFFLANFYPSGPFARMFSTQLPSFSRVSCGYHRFLCGLDAGSRVECSRNINRLQNVFVFLVLRSEIVDRI